MFRVQFLKVKYVKLKKIPESVAQLSFLKILNVRNNELETLPDAMLSLPLTEVHWAGNPASCSHEQFCQVPSNAGKSMTCLCSGGETPILQGIISPRYDHVRFECATLVPMRWQDSPRSPVCEMATNGKPHGVAIAPASWLSDIGPVLKSAELLALYDSVALKLGQRAAKVALATMEAEKALGRSPTVAVSTRASGCSPETPTHLFLPPLYRLHLPSTANRHPSPSNSCSH